MIYKVTLRPNPYKPCYDLVFIYVKFWYFFGKICAINTTTVTVTLETDVDVTEAGKTENYIVTIGEEAVSVTSVTYTANTNTAVLSVDLDGKAGIVSVNGVAASVSVDYEKPTMTAVQALNNKTLLVTFSESVDDVQSLTAGNYTLYNKVTGQSDVLNAAAGANNVEAVAAFANTEKTQVKITILSVGASVNGYPAGGLSNIDYILYASNVQDRATTPNTIVAASPAEFAGTLTPDTAGANLLSSTFNTATGDVTLQFDKAVTVASPADDKIYFEAGSTKVYLKNATDYTGIAGSAGDTKVSFTVDTTAGTGTLAQINALTGDLTVVAEKGAFTDGTNESEAVTSTPTLTQPPVLLGVTYDENTNTAVYKFSKAIDVSEITTFASKFALGGVDIDANSAATFNTTADSTDLSFTLSFADAQAVETALRAGTLTAAVDASSVQDADGNGNAAVSSSVVLTAGTDYVKDETAPTFTSATYKADTDTLELVFSEALRATVGDYTLANIEIYEDTDGVEGLVIADDTKLGDFSDFSAAANTNNHGAIQNTFNKADGTDATATDEMTTIYLTDEDGGAEELHDVIEGATGDVYLVIKADAVKDPSGNKIAADTTVKVTNIDVSNSTAVTADTTIAVANAGVFDVEFKNASGAVAMDPTTAGDASKYDVYLTANPLNKIAVKSVKLNADNTVATLFLETPMTESASALYSVKTSGILTATSEAGDVTTAETVDQGNDGDTTSLSATQNLVLTDKDTSGTVSAGDEIAITFNEAVVLPADLNITDLTVDNAHALGNSTFALGEDQATLTITVGSSATIAVGDTITFPVTVKDYEGNALVAGAAQTTNAMTVSGNVAPKISKAVFADANGDGAVSTGDTLAVKFDQNIKLADGKTATDLIDDIVETGTTFSAAVISGDTVTLTVDTAAFAVGDNVDVNGTPANVDVVNSWGTKAATTAVAVTSDDTTAPKVTAFEYDSANNKLIVSFDEAVNLAGTDADDIAKMIDSKLTLDSGTLGTVSAAALVAGDNTKVEITLTGESIDQFTTITVSVGAFDVDATTGTDGTNEVVQDASLNKAVRNQGTAYSITIK